MMMVEMHSTKAHNKSGRHNIDNTGPHNAIINDVTTQLMMSGEPPHKNHSQILVWTDKDSNDMFSLVLKQRLAYLRGNSCPILNECTFHFDKKAHIEDSETIVIATKRHFPYGGKESGKTWMLILPDPDFHRAWIKHGSRRHLDLKLLISYLPGANMQLVKAKYKKLIGPKLDTVRVSNGDNTNEARLAAVIIDECETEGQREEYVRALQQHTSVHIYGRCGAPCPGWVTEDCLRYLDKHYKFYLVFETHICQHFLSPDLWRFLATTSNMIPVVFGGVNYADFLPPEVGYIDALNHSPEVLGLTLNYLQANGTAFNKYKEWRDTFDLELTEWPCSLCERLRQTGRLNAQASINAQDGSDGLCTSWPTLDFAQPKN